MPSNGRVAGRLIVNLDMENAGFYKSATGAGKAVRGLKSQFKDLQRTHREMGVSQQSYNQQIKASTELMKAQQDRIRAVENSLGQMKKGTQQYQTRLLHLQNLRREYDRMSYNTDQLRKKELLHRDAITQINSKFKQQQSIIAANIQRYKSEGNALKTIRAERQQLRNTIERNNALWKEEVTVLKRVRSQLGANSAEYQEQKAKLRMLSAETKRYNAELTQMRQQQKMAIVQQKLSNSVMGRGMLALQKNKAGLIDLRNSFLGLTAAATGMAFPVAMAIGGAVRATVQWEDALSNVEKTTGASQKQMKQYGDSIRAMAKTMPESQSEIANTMAMAAQLGIKGGKDLKEFTKIATQMGVATDLSAEDAANAMAKIANVTGMPTSKMKNLGSTIVNLGNNMATQESTLVNFAQRLSGTGTTVGMAEKDIVALGAAMASVG